MLYNNNGDKMKNLAIVIFSCDKNEEQWSPFMRLLNKYWLKHPKVYLLTETIKCPFIETINYNYDLNHWTNRIRSSLNDIKEEYIIFISDDCFINNNVNTNKLNKCFDILKDNVASINFELSFDEHDIDSNYPGFKFKTKESSFRVSLLCGIWQKEKLIKVLEKDANPWEIEIEQNDYGFDYYQVTDEKIISWYHDEPYCNAGIREGKWQHGIEDFFKSENIEVDYTKKGFY